MGLMELNIVASEYTPDTPDIFDVSANNFIATLRSKPRSQISNVMINQNMLAGIGSYLNSEIFYRAGLLPTRKISEFSDEELQHLYDSMSSLLAEIVRASGNIKYEGTWEPKVYHREYDPEGRQVIHNRKLYYVPDIQF